MPWRMYLLPFGKLAGFHSLSSLRFGGGFWTERQISENQCLMLRMFGLVWFGWLVGLLLFVFFWGGCWGLVFCMFLFYFSIFLLKVHSPDSPNVFLSAFWQSDTDYDDVRLINKMAVN